jgi:inner membrane protein
MLFKHRGFFHSIIGFIWVVILWALVLGQLIANGLDVKIAELFLMGVAVGYVTHMAHDMLTNSGIQLLFPIKRHLGLGIIRTNSMRETVFMFAWIALSVVVIA